MERMSKSNMLKNVRLLIYVGLIQRTDLPCKKLNIALNNRSGCSGENGRCVMFCNAYPFSLFWLINYEVRDWITNNLPAHLTNEPTDSLTDQFIRCQTI
jgi:hypothetical protein